MNIANTMWSEKYRPKSLDDFVGNEDLVSKVKHWIDIQDVPNLLLYGPSGTGKTSIAKIISAALDADEYYINASSENGIDVLRDRIQSIVNTTSFSEWKIVILDESDGLTLSFQQAMRPVLENESGKTRFIFTANYQEKIIPALHSRLTSFYVVPPSKTAVCVRAKKILESEGIKFDPKSIVSIVNSYYPDQRKIVNALQKNSITGELIISNDLSLNADYLEKILTELKGVKDVKSSFQNIRQIIADSKVRQFDDLFRFLYDSIDDYTPDGKKAMMIYHIADGQYKAAIVNTDPEIQVAQMFVNILRELK